MEPSEFVLFIYSFISLLFFFFYSVAVTHEIGRADTKMYKNDIFFKLVQIVNTAQKSGHLKKEMKKMQNGKLQTNKTWI